MADDWKRVGRAIEARIAELAMSKAEVIRRSGVSDKTLTAYMRGKPIVRPDKRRELCQALGWTPDSIDRLVAGYDPKEHDAPAMSDMNVRLDRIEDRLAAIERAVVDAIRGGGRGGG